MKEKKEKRVATTRTVYICNFNPIQGRTVKRRHSTIEKGDEILGYTASFSGRHGRLLGRSHRSIARKLH